MKEQLRPIRLLVIIGITIAIPLGILAGYPYIAYFGGYLQTWEPLPSATGELKPLHSRPPLPKPGDWVWTHPEHGQWFMSYADDAPESSTVQKGRIYIQPIGEIGERYGNILKTTTDYVSRFFCTPAELLEPISLEALPESAYRWRPDLQWKQYNTGHLQRKILLPNKPDDAIAYLGFLTADLWPGGGWNFVFGSTRYDKALGLFSTARFGDQERDYQLFLKRTLVTASHEIAHMLRFKHCIAYQCTMNASGSIPEADLRPFHLCPICLQKLQLATGCDSVKRLLSLRTFYEQNGFHSAASFAEKSQILLQGSSGP